jgi:hypothetical protein
MQEPLPALARFPQGSSACSRMELERGTLSTLSSSWSIASVLGHAARVLPDWRLRHAAKNLVGCRCPRRLRTLSLSPAGRTRPLRQPAGVWPQRPAAYHQDRLEIEGGAPGCAACTLRTRPAWMMPWRPAIAACAAWRSIMATEPQPRERPVYRSIAMWIMPTAPYGAKSWRRSCAVTLDARLLTAMFIRMPCG